MTVPPTGAYAHERCVPFSVVSMRVEEQAIILGEQGNFGGGHQSSKVSRGYQCRPINKTANKHAAAVRFPRLLPAAADRLP